MTVQARPPALLGIDLGTSSVKVIVTDLRGGMVGQATRSYRRLSLQPSWSESEPTEWLAATSAAVGQAMTEMEVDVQGIGFSGQMHGLVASAANGGAVRPAMLWSDSRAVAELRSFSSLPPSAQSRLGNPLTPGMAGPMLLWLKRNEPGAYAATRWALQPKDWLRAQFTGEFWSEPSDASATLLYDVEADGWDFGVMDLLGVDRSIVPELLPRSASVAGRLTTTGAGILGLRVGTPVAVGAADTAAAALGSGLTHEGTAQLTVGSGAQVVTPLLRRMPHELAPVIHEYRAATNAGWYRLGAVVSAGLTLDWVRDVLSVSWSDLYAAAAVAMAADDPIFLPHLNGERTPYFDPSMRGAWVGLSPRHDKSDLIRAALEGVAFAIREAVSAVLDATRVPELRLAGGGSVNQHWRQLLADVLAIPLRPIQVPAASGRGAALLAGEAAGLWTESEVLALVSTDSASVRLDPTDGNVRVHEERYGRYLRLVEALKQ